MQMIDAPSSLPAIIVTHRIGIRLISQVREFQHGFHLIHGPVAQVFSGHHAWIELREIGVLDNALDAAKGIEVVTPLLFVQIEDRYHMPSGNDQGMSRVYRVCIKYANE
jgi:hypothetical protein